MDKFLLLEKVRENVKSDWLIRDLYIKFLMKNRDRIDFAHSYLMNKLCEDYYHLKTLITVSKELEKRGVKHFILNQYSRGVDIIALSGDKAVGIEVKGHGPPWGGTNNQEYLEYINSELEIHYVWMENGRLYHTSLGKVKLENDGKLTVLEKQPLEYLLNRLKPLKISDFMV